MKQYVLTIFQPDGPPPESLDMDKLMADVAALIDEMKAAGAHVYNGALYPAELATVVRVNRGDALITDGPYTEGKEHIGGFVIVQANDLDEALEWARKTATVITLPIEVRPVVDPTEP